MVEPREMEIKDLKEEKTKMESELERFNKQNVQLELNNKEKESRLEATQKELKEERTRVNNYDLLLDCLKIVNSIKFISQKREAELELKRIKTDIHNCVGYIQDSKLLKEGIKSIYQKYVHDDVVIFE